MMSLAQMFCLGHPLKIQTPQLRSVGGDIQWNSSDQTSELANGNLVAIWSAYNGSGVYASILDPLTADFTTIDLTDSLGLVSGGGNDGLEAHHISILPDSE